MKVAGLWPTPTAPGHVDCDRRLLTSESAVMYLHVVRRLSLRWGALTAPPAGPREQADRVVAVANAAEGQIRVLATNAETVDKRGNS
eukprot:COSAG05_NODE_1187_length_5585_cov_47.661502_5_plen_87_part_00